MNEDIYIVDDDAAVRDSLRALFEAHGFVVHDFASGVDFLQRHEVGARGCLVLDVNLPGLDGFEVLKRLEAAGARLPVIIMTAGTDGQTSTNAFEAGAVGFVQKPFVSSQLLALIRQALDGEG